VSGVPQQQGHGGNMLLCVDILEMYTAVCSLLSKCVVLDEACHSTVLHTHDCGCSLLALLDPGRYCEYLGTYRTIVFCQAHVTKIGPVCTRNYKCGSAVTGHC
jgi:hypothetical protein